MTIARSVMFRLLTQQFLSKRLIRADLEILSRIHRRLGDIHEHTRAEVVNYFI